eukprot:c38760_g1_i1 orf=1273-2256(-)
MPEVFHSCFGEHRIQASGLLCGRKGSPNVVTSLYRTKLAGSCRLVSITWCKSLMGQALSVCVDHPAIQYTCKVGMRPWQIWKKQGCKSFDIGAKMVEVFWDLSSAKYFGGPEPQEYFYVALVCDQEIVLLLGDLQKDALKKCRVEIASIEATLLLRKEHVPGKKSYSTKAQFGDNGRTHDIAIECNTRSEKEPRLYVRVDKQVVIQVTRLMWKFRGNQTILVDGIPVEVFWDVHNWLFSPSDGHAVFMFQCSLSNEKPWLKEVEVPAPSVHQEAAFHSLKDTMHKLWVTENSSASVLRLPTACSLTERGPCRGAMGFSLLLHAWKDE